MPQSQSALIVGASRGIGLAMVEELLKRSWRVTGTVRQGKGALLHALGTRYPGRLGVEHLDINAAEQLDALDEELRDKTFDLLFVNAGVAIGRDETVETVSTDDFVHLMVTNALSPMKIVERLTKNVPRGGTVGVMSSGQGSITDNVRGQAEVYRASKAALNMLMRSFAARRGSDHALLLLAPGWIRTDLGGPGAKFKLDEVIGDIVDTIVAQAGRPGLRYLDRFGATVNW